MYLKIIEVFIIPYERINSFHLPQAGERRYKFVFPVLMIFKYFPKLLLSLLQMVLLLLYIAD